MTKRRSSPEPSNDPAKRINLGKTTLEDVTKAIFDAISRVRYGDIGDDEIIQHSESMLKDLQDLSATVHVARASAFERKGDINKAMEEASNAIKASPGIPEGYLITSYLYGTRGQHEAAIEVLEDGLRAVQPSYQGVLYDSREEARRLSEIKIDFVLKLPSEVLSRIFSFMEEEEVDDTLLCMKSCTRVSKSWRSLLLQQANGWETSKLGADSAWHAPTKFFQRTTPFIKDLHICSEGNQMKSKLIDLAQKGMFSALRNLRFYYIDTPRDMDRSLTLITILGKQLTLLSIQPWADMATCSIPLDTILTVCTNLKELYIDYEDHRDALIPSEWATLPLQSNLEILDFKESRLTAEVFEWIIPRCPRLKKLCTLNAGSQLFVLLSRHCPDLKYAYLAGRIVFYQFSPPRRNDEQKGLQFLSCYHNDEGGLRLIGNLAPLLTRNKDTLEGIAMGAVHQDVAVMQRLWKTVATVQYSHLTEIFFECDAATSGTDGSGISKFLQQCPALKKLYLKISGEVPNTFFATLIKLPNLRDLALFNFETCGGLKQYLDHLIALGHQSPLEVLGINHFKGMTDELLFAVAKIMTLRIIHFRGDFPLLGYRAMPQFFRLLESNGNLDVLMMDNTLRYIMSTIGVKLANLNNMTRNLYIKSGEKHNSITLRRKKQ